MSPHHSSSVALVLNLQTGHVTPQFHVVIDDTFSAVEYLQSGKAPPFWDELVRHNTEQFGRVDPSDTILDIEQLLLPASMQMTIWIWHWTRSILVTRSPHQMIHSMRLTTPSISHCCAVRFVNELDAALIRNKPKPQKTAA